jgi:hypothetical protein
MMRKGTKGTKNLNDHVLSPFGPLCPFEVIA